MRKRLDKLLEDSELTSEDAVVLGEKVKEARLEKLEQMGYF